MSSNQGGVLEDEPLSPLDPDDLDPVSKDPLLDPVRASNGFTYNGETLDALWKYADEAGKVALSPMTRRPLSPTWEPQPRTKERVMHTMFIKGYDLDEPEYARLLGAPTTSRRSPRSPTLELRRILRLYRDDWAAQNELPEVERRDLQLQVDQVVRQADEIDRISRAVHEQGPGAPVQVDPVGLLALLGDTQDPRFEPLMRDTSDATLESETREMSMGAVDYLALLYSALRARLDELSRDESHGPWTRQMARDIQRRGGVLS